MTCFTHIKVFDLLLSYSFETTVPHNHFFVLSSGCNVVAELGDGTASDRAFVRVQGVERESFPDIPDSDLCIIGNRNHMVPKQPNFPDRIRMVGVQLDQFGCFRIMELNCLVI